MTKVISRYFDSAGRARAVRHELVERQDFSPFIVDVHDRAKDLADRLRADYVDADTIAEYEKRMKSGGGVVVVRARYKPLGVAKTAREVMARMGAVDLGDLIEEVYVKDAPETQSQKILYEHPLLMTRKLDQSETTYHMADWPIPLISRRKPSRASAIRPHAFMADKPIGHLVPHNVRYGRFPFDLLVPGNKFMANFPFGHIVPGHKFMAKFPFAHIVPGHKFMAKFPFAHIVPGHKLMAGFPFGHLVPRPGFMANWPFPHLINGKQGQNAIIPGSPFMANFPIPHLSKRKPSDKFAFPRHAHMANFPLPLLSRRKPADPYAFPRHAHMADFILPLVTRRSEEAPDGDKRFSFSRMLGLPTLKPR